MFKYLFQMQDIYLFALLSCVSIVFSLVSIALIKRFVPVRMRYRGNAVIGNAASLIGLMYGVLAGLSALYLINNISYTADAVQREANAVADMYRDSKWLQEPARTEIQSLLKNYLTEVIQVEWPRMERGEKVDLTNGIIIIDNITNQLVNYSGVSNSESLLVHDMLDEIKILYDARELRINMSYAQLSPELWIVILLGTFLTLVINFFFGMNYYLHAIVVIATALMTSSMIFLLITLDRPFQGEFVIDETAFKTLFEVVNRNDIQQKIENAIIKPKPAPVNNTVPKVILHAT